MNSILCVRVRKFQLRCRVALLLYVRNIVSTTDSHPPPPPTPHTQLVVSPVRKLARSSLDIHRKNFTDEDMDKMLKEMALYQVEDSSQQPRTSTPPPENVMPLSEIVGSLQRGFTMPDEDLTGQCSSSCLMVSYNSWSFVSCTVF